MNIHCSACGAPLPQGAKFCPACALPLTAIAMPTPAPPRPRPISFWWYVLGAIVILATVCNVADNLQRPKEEAAAAARKIAADKQRDAEWELVRSLSTPELFQAKCGRALAQRSGISSRDGNFDAIYRRHAVTLVYRMPDDLVQGDVMDVIFTPSDKDMPTSFREHFDDRTHAVIPYDGLIIIGCAKDGAQ
jgi:hypothetical protein